MRKNKLISLFLAAVMIVSCIAITGVSSSAATDNVVYFDNSVTGFSQVYCYMSDNYGSNAEFPGEAMTKVSDDIWSYKVDGDWKKLIFTDGEIQSADLDYTGGSQIAVPDSAEDDFTVTWSAYPEAETNASTAPTQKKAKVQTGAGGTVYCQNANSSWSKVYCYMWKDGSGNNHEWPGEQMTSLGDGTWEYNYSGNFDMIIFNNGSGGGDNQTQNISFPGSGKIYDIAAGKWEDYNPSPVKISSLTTGIESPSYTNISVVISAKASSSKGSLTYKFSVKGAKSATQVLSEGSSSTVAWIPTVADNYKITVDVKDSAGNTNSRSIDFEVKDGTNLDVPFISAFTNSLGSNKYLKLNSAVTFTTSAIGGKVGTNLLFYKFVITDPDGNDNTAYYTTGSTYTYTPKKKGTYTVNAYVQNSYNDTINNTYTYICGDTIPSDDQDETTPVPVTQPYNPTQPSSQQETFATVPNPTLGDVNCDGSITVKDATLVQKSIVKLVALTSNQEKLADVTKDNAITVKDATLIQKYVVKLVDSF